MNEVDASLSTSNDVAVVSQMMETHFASTM